MGREEEACKIATSMFDDLSSLEDEVDDLLPIEIDEPYFNQLRWIDDSTAFGLRIGTSIIWDDVLYIFKLEVTKREYRTLIKTGTVRLAKG